MTEAPTTIRIPLLVIQPGYYVLAIFVWLIAMDVHSRFGPVPSVLVASAALALPLLSYVIRTANPRQVSVDPSNALITLTYARFGRTWQRSYDLKQFRGVYWSIFNGRFPKIDLRLERRDGKDIRLFWLDYSGERRRQDVPAAMAQVAAVLVARGLEDMTKPSQPRRSSL